MLSLAGSENLGCGHCYLRFFVLRWCDWRRQKSIKLKAFNTLINCFHSFEEAKSWSIRLTIKTLLTYLLKSVLVVASLCTHVGAFAWLLMRHFYFSCGNPARAWLVRTLLAYVRRFLVYQPKNQHWISLKVHCIMSYLSNFERSLPDDLWVMTLRRLEIFQRMYGLFSAFAKQNFISFWWLITRSLSKLKGLHNWRLN